MCVCSIKLVDADDVKQNKIKKCSIQFFFFFGLVW